jgi:hypothetical protein
VTGRTRRDAGLGTAALTFAKQSWLKRLHDHRQ